MNPDFLQTLTVDQYPFDPQYAKRLRSFFSDGLIRPFSDGEISELKHVTFAPLLFGNRSGSNLLTESLHRAGLGFPEHGEPLNVPSIENIAARHDLTTFTDYFLFLSRRWKQHNVVGFKLGIGQLFELTRLGLLDHFAEIKLLHSVRRDRLAQAVSHYIAKASGDWSTKSENRSALEIPYSAKDILQYLRRGARLRADFDLYQTIHGVPSLEVWYEDFVAKPQQHVEAIASFLGCRADVSKVNLQSASTQPQRGDLNHQFERRFRQEMQELH